MIDPTLLDVTNYWVSGGADVLSFLRMGKDGNTLRLVCKEMKDNCTLYPWMEGMNEGGGASIRKLCKVSKIHGSVRVWRECYPNARAANVGAKLDEYTKVLVPPPSVLYDDDFAHFSGMQYLDISEQHAITDAAFVHLKGIHTLTMWGCNQPTITNAAFIHLKGIQTLDMGGCNQPTITNAAFVHLKGIHTL